MLARRGARRSWKLCGNLAQVATEARREDLRSVSFLSISHTQTFDAHLLAAIDDPHKIVKVVASDGKSGDQKDVSYTNCKVIGNGSSSRPDSLAGLRWVATLPSRRSSRTSGSRSVRSCLNPSTRHSPVWSDFEVRSSRIALFAPEEGRTGMSSSTVSGGGLRCTNASPTARWGKQLSRHEGASWMSSRGMLRLS